MKGIDITALFICLDDFCKIYELSVKHKLLPSKNSTRNRAGYLSLSEMLLIEILYHVSPYKDFKHFYMFGILIEHKNKFKKLPCYSRFVKLKKDLFMPLSLILQAIKGEETGIYFADSTPLKVCHNKRINRNKVFNGLAQRGKGTMGWFFGFKLHLIVNNKGQIMAVRISKGNKDDRPALENMVGGLKGKCFADKGYISKKLFASLWKKGLHLVTGIKRNMKNYLMPFIDKMLLRKRFIIETIFGVMKRNMDLEHTRHRSSTNAFVSVMACLVAYSYKSNKPAIKAFLINT
jgi:hypothetical protein